MNELERALDEYLATNFQRGEVVELRRLQDEVASRFVSEGLPISEALTIVRRYVRAMLKVSVLVRLDRGIYIYKPDGSDYMVALPDRATEISRIPHEFPISYVNPRRQGDISAFNSVAALASSSEFLIQTDISEVDLVMLQGLSL